MASAGSDRGRSVVAPSLSHAGAAIESRVKRAGVSFSHDLDKANRSVLGAAPRHAAIVASFCFVGSSVLFSTERGAVYYMTAAGLVRTVCVIPGGSRGGGGGLGTEGTGKDGGLMGIGGAAVLLAALPDR